MFCQQSVYCMYHTTRHLNALSKLQIWAALSQNKRHEMQCHNKKVQYHNKDLWSITKHFVNRYLSICQQTQNQLLINKAVFLNIVWPKNEHHKLADISLWKMPNLISMFTVYQPSSSFEAFSWPLIKVQPTMSDVVFCQCIYSFGLAELINTCWLCFSLWDAHGPNRPCFSGWQAWNDASKSYWSTPLPKMWKNLQICTHFENSHGRQAYNLPWISVCLVRNGG